MKTLGLLTISNLFIVTTIYFILHFFGFDYVLTKIGVQWPQLLIFSIFWGFLCSFLSLVFAKIVAKWFLGVSIINPKSKLSTFEENLLRLVNKISTEAGIKPPQVGIYDSTELNAFATGMFKNRAMIAFTSNIFTQMDWEEIEAVIAHEISHIKNGDMVTMTLIQGLVNSFSIFFARMLGFVLMNSIFGSKSKFFNFTFYIYNIIVGFLQGVFLFIGSFFTNFVSRHREYKADEMAANMIGKRKMIKALYKLMQFEKGSNYSIQLKSEVFQTLKISNKTSFFGLMDTHPSLENRIKRIHSLNNDIEN